MARFSALQANKPGGFQFELHTTPHSPSIPGMSSQGENLNFYGDFVHSFHKEIQSILDKSTHFNLIDLSRELLKRVFQLYRERIHFPKVISIQQLLEI